jgi:hypothetical protein
MKVSCSSKTPVDFQQTILHYVPEDRTLHIHECENLESYTNKTITGGIYLKYKMMPKAVLIEFLDIITHSIFFAVA